MDGWFFAGVAALGSTVAIVWQQARNLFGYVASWVIVPVYLDEGLMQTAARLYAKDKLKRMPAGSFSYTAYSMFVRSLQAYRAVAMEQTAYNGGTFLQGWRPIWFGGLKRPSAGRGSDDSDQKQRVSFIRGTFDRDKLIKTFVDYYNNVYKREDDEQYANERRRHCINFVFGTSKKHNNGSPNEIATPSQRSNIFSSSDWLDKVPLGWDVNDLGHGDKKRGSALSRLALSPAAQQLYRDIERWLRSEQWYRERGIPWRRGCRCVGKPGTGKSSLVRAIGEDLDIPITVFDLATLYNDELRQAWCSVLARPPHIALFEDFDGVFEGRKNVSGGELTFDAVLNCFDGVERAEGVFVVITTNKEHLLDEGIIRDGRCGTRVEFGPLDEAGRYHVASRILVDHPDRWDEIVRQHGGSTGAKFTEACKNLAEGLYWNDPEFAETSEAA